MSPFIVGKKGRFQITVFSSGWAIPSSIQIAIINMWFELLKANSERPRQLDFPQVRKSLQSKPEDSPASLPEPERFCGFVLPHTLIFVDLMLCIKIPTCASLAHTKPSHCDHRGDENHCKPATDLLLFPG